MKLKTILIIFLFNCIVCNAQNKSLPTGIYYHQTTTEFYVFLTKNKFIYCRFATDKQKIHTIGAGSWLMTDEGNLFLNYNDNPQTKLILKALDYKTKTVIPYDSLYFQGHITAPSGKNAGYSSVTFPKIRKGITADSLGNFSFKIPYLPFPEYIEFSYMVGIPQRITLIKNYNSHFFQISFEERKDEIQFVEEKNKIFSFIRKLSSTFIFHQGLALTPSVIKLPDLILMLEKSKSLQPLEINTINWLINQLNNN